MTGVRLERVEEAATSRRVSQTYRFSPQRLGQVGLAIALILTVKLVKWAKRWTD